MTKFFGLMRKALLGAAFLAAGVGAQAADVSVNGSDPYNFSWSYLATCTNPATCGTQTQLITGTGTIDATTNASGQLVLAITLNNTTSVPAGNNMALLSFGFGISPNATSVSFSAGTTSGAGAMDDAGLVTQQGSTNIPSLQNLEICAFAVAGGNCSGGSVTEGIQASSSDSFTLTLGGTWGTSVTIQPIGFKFQGTIGSFEFYSSSSSSSSTSTSTGTVSEPGTSAIALLGLGLLGAALRSRRRAKQG